MEPLFGKTLGEISEIAASLGMPRYTAVQICKWLYQKNIGDISEMTDISLKNRESLSSAFCVGLRPPVKAETSADETKKYLFPTSQGGFIEAAYIPEGDRATLCVSSQAGCRMGCKFCMTAIQGLSHNLSVSDILNQIRSLTERETLTNIVYMGMGEPLDNLENVLKSLEILTSPWGYGWSPTRITVSTAGITPKIDQFLAGTKAHLAVSLHNPFSEQRSQIMPIEKAYPVAELISILKSYDFSRQRRLSFEYIVLKDINDSPEHIKELAKLLNGLSCRINLIRFHEIPGSPYVSPSREKMEWFRDALSKKGILTTIRASRGEDIKAACGLLSTGRGDIR